MLPLHASSFVFDPADPRNVWAGTGDVFFVPPAVYRSSDGGETWLPANEGLESHLTIQLTIDATGQRLYAASTGVFDIEVRDFERSVVPPRGSPPRPKAVGPRP